MSLHLDFTGLATIAAAPRALTSARYSSATVPAQQSDSGKRGAEWHGAVERSDRGNIGAGLSGSSGERGFFGTGS